MSLICHHSVVFSPGKGNWSIIFISTHACYIQSFMRMHAHNIMETPGARFKISKGHIGTISRHKCCLPSWDNIWVHFFILFEINNFDNVGWVVESKSRKNGRPLLQCKTWTCFDKSTKYIKSFIPIFGTDTNCKWKKDANFQLDKIRYAIRISTFDNIYLFEAARLDLDKCSNRENLRDKAGDFWYNFKVCGYIVHQCGTVWL